MVATFLGAFKNIVELINLGLEAKSRRLLQKKFGRGPYDEATIDISTRYYVRPKCTNIDPARELEIRHALVAAREDLFDKVDIFLDSDASRRHLLLLADSGTGKTSFVLNYYAYNQRRSKKKRHQLALVPLGIKDADAFIARVTDAEDTVLLLDAFDEDTKAIRDHRERLRSLMENCKRFKRIIITCRTQFFPRDEEIPVETGMLKIGPRKAGEKGSYEFWKLYLSPFDDNDVKQYIRKRFPFWAFRDKKKARSIAVKISLLSARAMLLAYIPDIIRSNKQINQTRELYEEMVDAWLERESSWADKKALREFSERLAVDIYVNRETRGTERVPYAKLPECAIGWGLPLQQWQLTGRSLLNRDAEGNYKFAHRSIMEYLFTLRLFKGDPACFRIPLTNQMKRFLAEFCLPSIRSIELESLSRFFERADFVAVGFEDRALFGELHGALTRDQSHFLGVLRDIGVDQVTSLVKLQNDVLGRFHATVNDMTMVEAKELRKTVCRALPPALHSMIEKIIMRFGVESLLPLKRLNEVSDLRMLPTSIDLDQFVLEFVVAQA